MAAIPTCAGVWRNLPDFNLPLERVLVRVRINEARPRAIKAIAIP
jgi:hypothetical protein